MRKTKDLISSLDPFKKRELVQSLETKKDKEKQQRLAIAQRRAAEKAAAQKAGEHSKTVLKAPTKSRAFTDMMAKLEVDDASLTSLDFSIGSWWLTGEAPNPIAYPGSQSLGALSQTLNYHRRRGRQRAVQGSLAQHPRRGDQLSRKFSWPARRRVCCEMPPAE